MFDSPNKNVNIYFLVLSQQMQKIPLSLSDDNVYSPKRKVKYIEINDISLSSSHCHERVWYFTLNDYVRQFTQFIQKRVQTGACLILIERDSTFTRQQTFGNGVEN